MLRLHSSEPIYIYMITIMSPHEFNVLGQLEGKLKLKTTPET